MRFLYRLKMDQMIKRRWRDKEEARAGNLKQEQPRFFLFFKVCCIYVLKMGIYLTFDHREEF